MSSMTRRFGLKLLGLTWLLLGLGKRRLFSQEAIATATKFTSNWHRLPNRVWLGESFWANPMEDWRIADGAAECTSTGSNRNVHCLTQMLVRPNAAFRLRVEIDCIEKSPTDTGAGFRIGIQSDINEYRSNCFANLGLDAGWVDGKLKLGPVSVATSKSGCAEKVELVLEGSPAGDMVSLKLSAFDRDGRPLGEAKHSVAPEKVVGNVAIVNNFSAAAGKTPKAAKNVGKQDGGRYRFRNWEIGGEAFQSSPDRKFGPILWSMYSLSDSRGPDGFVMKMTVLTGPLGDQDTPTVELEIECDGKWTSLGSSTLDRDAWTAGFRIPNWNEKLETRYRLHYRQKFLDGTEEISEWSGVVLPNPADRPLRIAGLTCQNDYAFPYEPVANNLLRLKPDLLYFSGDQIYESHGGYGIIRNPADRAILNYLRKFYQFGWSFREAMRNAPTICIPDDHDVFHGNLWGEGGKPADADDSSSSGGYLEPARMVNVVHRTNASHHPDYYDPTPVEQGISVYYGDLVYGGVGFAIVGDRQFKSGPLSVKTNGPRPDHVDDPNFDTAKLDVPGLILLGERQERFLEQWVGDWRGHSMKILLSQTVFSAVATHHGKFDGYLKADLDSGAWPQTPRNRAISILRKGKVLHLNGDQHLTSMSQYGVEKQRDACWSFCTPAIAVSYPRWWRPDEVGMPHANRPKHGLLNTGEYLDGFGNKVYVYAVGNPEAASLKHRYELAHQKGSGFGMVTVDTKAKTYFVESFRFLIDATDGKPSNQFPGWPITIHQDENAGENRLG